MVFNGLYFYKEFKTLGIQSKQQTSLIMTSYIGFSSTKPASRRHFAERKECFFFGGGGGFRGASGSISESGGLRRVSPVPLLALIYLDPNTGTLSSESCPL